MRKSYAGRWFNNDKNNNNLSMITFQSYALKTTLYIRRYRTQKEKKNNNLYTFLNVLVRKKLSLKTMIQLLFSRKNDRTRTG